MKITINGQAIEVKDKLEIRLDIEPAGESFPCIQMEMHGGTAFFCDASGTGLNIAGKGGAIQIGQDLLGAPNDVFRAGRARLAN